MNTSPDQLQEWMDSKENEHLEFKEAKQGFHFEKLVKYCAALANEGGGKIILGINDKIPRRVVGCNALSQLERTKAGLIERLRLRIEGEEIAHPEGRVLIFHVPSQFISGRDGIRAKTKDLSGGGKSRQRMRKFINCCILHSLYKLRRGEK